MVSYTIFFRRDKILNQIFEEVKNFTCVELTTEIQADIKRHDKFDYGEIEAFNICDEDYWVYIRIVYKDILFYYKYDKETGKYKKKRISHYEIKMFSEDYGYKLINK